MKIFISEALERRTLLSAVPVGPEFAVNTYTTGAQTLPRVAMDANGGFIITWYCESQSGSYAQRYNASGVPQGGEFRMKDRGVQSIAMGTDGDFVIAFQGSDGADDGVYAQRYDALGVPQGSEFLVNTYTTGSQLLPSAAMDADGNFVIAWTSRGQEGLIDSVYAQRFSALGVPQGSEFRVNTYTLGGQDSPTVAMDADGDFVIAWMSRGQDGGGGLMGYGVYAQRYDATGVPQGSEFRANTYTTNDQWDPRVAMDADGNFVIAWVSTGQDGSSGGVYAQRYNASGVPLGGEFRVNTYTTGSQYHISSAMAADGEFVIAWRSEGQDGSSGGIYAQHYDASGVPLGPEFRANTFTPNVQTMPSVAMNAHGGFVIAWASLHQDGSDLGVYAQRYGLAPDVPLSWTTVDDFVQPLADPQSANPRSYAIPADMAADSSGGVYVAGESWDYSTSPNDRGYALLRYKSGTSSEFQTIAAVPNTGSLIAKFHGVATAPDDSVYLVGTRGGTASSPLHRIWKGSWDASGTNFSLAEVDIQSTISWRDVTVDGAGNVFALGQYTASQGGGVVRWVVRKQTGGQGAFVTVNDFIFGNNVSTYPSAITAVRSGPNAGVYAVGRTDSRWLVRKSSNAGSTWSTVDNFQLESSTNAPAAATAITGHENGTIHVAGRASVRIQTGGTAKKPTYSFFHRWYMRSSSNGGSTWTNHDVYPPSAGTSTSSGTANAVTTDEFGNVYVAGTFNNLAIVRSNAGGSWSTSSEFSGGPAADGAKALSLTRDSSGALYLGANFYESAPTYNGHWIVQSMNPTAAPQSGGTGLRSIFSGAAVEEQEDHLAELI